MISGGLIKTRKVKMLRKRETREGGTREKLRENTERTL